MLMHHLKYALKTLFKNKMLIFWTFAFPIILGTLFYFAFSNIENNEKLDIINIAIIENESLKNNPIWQQSFDALSDEQSENRLFHTRYTTEKEASDLLAQKEITGYLILNENKPKIVVSSSGINETIFQFVTEEIAQTKEIVTNVIENTLSNETLNKANNPNDFYTQIYQEVLELSQEKVTNIEDTSSKNLSYTMIEFYTLIAMTCLYGGILGMVTINQTLANMSSTGKRVAVSPTPKIKMVLSSAFASYITQLLGIALLFLYTIFVLKVDYGPHIQKIILLACVGCFAGLSLGIAIASLLKTNENIKTGIILSITMFGCFLSGMMGITMKYIVDKNIPILNKINPANRITDGFYSLYYYNTFDRYYRNITGLLIFSCLMIIIAIGCLRRQKYDCI